MKIEYEIVKPDEGCSFRVLHHRLVRTSDFVWQYHYHPECEIVFVPFGSGTRHIGNHISTYRNGDLVLIGSNLPHSGFGLHSNDLHEEIVLQIKPELLPTHLLEMEAINQLLDRSKYGIVFSGNTREIVGRKIRALMNASPFNRMLGMLEIFQLLATADDYLLLNKQIVSPLSITKHQARLQKIFTYVENESHEEISLQKAAQIAGLSVPSFCNFFKKATNITFSAFVNQYRIQRACQLLHQDKSVSEVCYACGFNNVTYFNKIFKQFTRQTPTAFRNNIVHPNF